MKYKKNEILSKIDLEEDVKIEFKFIDEEIIQLTNAVIAKILVRHDKLYLLYPLLTIMRELIVNSLKANAKRIFFEINGLNINDEVDYDLGISLFRETIVGDFALLHEYLEDADLKIIFSVKSLSKGISFKVLNNSNITEGELIRINEKIKYSVSTENIKCLFDKMNDEKEGAGLGIMLIIMCLKNMGLSESSFNFQSDGTNTIAEIIIPNEIFPIETKSKLKELIINQVDGLPTFPQNVVDLLQLCSDPNVIIKEVAHKIKMDISISTDVMKLANSAKFVSTSHIDEIDSAIMKIGLKNVESILIASNARKIMESRFQEFHAIWDHCNKVAFYSRLIASIYNIKGEGENAFLAGLLHDLGMIILLSIDSEATEKIAELVLSNKLMEGSVLEETSIGMSHSEIGGLISEKWNFPDFLVQAIRYHHSPELADEKYSIVTFIVYLANFLCGVEDRKYYYGYADSGVLDYFQISGSEELIDFHDKIKEKYQDLMDS